MSEATPTAEPPKPSATRRVRGVDRYSRVYAEALLDAALDRDVEEAMLQDVEHLTAALPARAEIRDVLTSRVLPRKERARILTEAFGTMVSPLFLDFLLVLNQRDRLFMLRSILTAVDTLRDERAKRVRVRIVSAVPLGDAQLEALRGLLVKALPGREPVLEPRLDQDILGGLIVQVGDHVFDGSVRSRLESIRTDLLAGSSHEIQRGRDRFRTV